MNANPPLSEGLLERITDSIARASGLFNVLSADIDALRAGTTMDDIARAVIEEADANSSLHRARRNYVRACFAFFEANCHALKFLALNFQERLSAEDQFLCKELDVDVDDQGQVVNRKKKTRFLPNLRYAFDVFARAFALQELPDYGHDNFRKLRNCVAIRDRLTHPKDLPDLMVSVDDLVSMAVALAWFSSEFHKVAGAGMKALSATVDKAKGP